METRITATLTGEIGRTRADIMERIDRQQTRADHLDDQITLGFGETDKATAESRLLGEQLQVLNRIVRRIEARVRGLEDKPGAGMGT
jgi:hypothetical protein